ncbi:Cytochrome c553 [Pasteurella testudinis DSM 23072]|uniref:Cytochrome c553 n=1 Tax=Pasteurella testudinis DSM 23072 TaxID=1122938 RepID=A0A1W1V044_9PAST|nr:c-type cytochrome [Pasteurella testudinis]SMB86725.1 Cytochrome c553 [Pasteurella testudinis DSM 23072]SUB51868.1 tetratricopeptide-like helical family protein [Pasteurella testudinis]
MRFHFFPSLCAITLALLTAQSAVAEADIAKGKRQYQQLCAMCHGRNAEKQAFDTSAVIAGMAESDIVTALEKRKNGEIEGAGNTVKARLSEQDRQNLAAYIATLGE